MEQPDNALVGSPEKPHDGSWWALSSSICRGLKSYLLPGKERERLVRSSQTLYDSVHKLVLSANQACDIVEQHLNISPPRVKVKDTFSIEEVLDNLVPTMYEIHVVAESTEKHVRKNLSPTLYDKLVFSRTSLEEKNAIIHDFQENTMGIFGSVSGPIVAVLLKRGNLPGSMQVAMPQVKASPVLALNLQDLLLRSDDIACAIQGEKAAGLHRTWHSPLTRGFSDGDAKVALEEAASHVEAATAVLRPLSENVQFIVFEVETYCKLIAEAGI